MMNSRPTKKPEQRGPFRNLRMGIAKMISSKVFLSVASLLIAVVFWSVLVASDGTMTREKVFPSVAVSVTGESTLRSRGYIVMDDISQLVPSVRMAVEVTQANYSRVSGTSYNPHFDVTQVTGEGENELTIAYSSQLYGPVTSCEPTTVKVHVERYITRRIPVVFELTGTLDESLYLDSSRVDPATLSVSGPQSLVSGVARAVVRLDLSTLSAQRMSDKTALSVELQDTAGTTLEDTSMLDVTNQSVITRTVTVETELMPRKNVPLDTQAFVTGEPAEGYVLTGITLSAESLPVAAAQEVLDALTVLSTDSPMNITGAMSDVTGTVRLRRPAGIENTLPTEVEVTAQIEETTIERTFRNILLETEGVPDGMSVSLSSSRITAQLTGGYGFISGLDSADIRLYVDVNGLEAGRYEGIPVQIHIDNAQNFSCALSSPEVTATLKSR